MNLMKNILIFVGVGILLIGVSVISFNFGKGVEGEKISEIKELHTDEFHILSSTINESMSLSTDELLDACTRPNEAWISFCNGYVQAIYDAYHEGLDGRLDPICAPTGTTRTELADNFIEMALQLQGMGELKAVSVVYVSMSRKYPCD